MQRIPWVETGQTATEFHMRSQQFIHTHNETLSVAVSVCDPDRAALAIQR